MNPLYFRFAEEPDPEVFVPGWVEILDGRFSLDRSVWRSTGVSRSPEASVVLRADHDFGVWELKNLARGRVVVLSDGSRRAELQTDMSMTLRPGRWTASVTDLFSFVATTVPPDGPVRRQDEDRRQDATADAAGDGAAGAVGAGGGDGPDGEEPDEEFDDDDLGSITTPHALVPRARAYLGTHWTKRMALAYMWRQHLVHTRDLAEDLPTSVVARAFEVSDKKITRWREDLANHVFYERGHQHLIRDWLIKHDLMSSADVVEADRYVEGLVRNRPWRR